MRSFLFSFIFFFTACCAFSQSERTTFSKAEVLADLDYLYTSLQDAHYNVYAYISENEFRSAYEKVKTSITKDSLSTLEVINRFQPLTSAIKNGHTAIEFPIPQYLAYINAGGTLFPLEIAFENNTTLVRRNWSTNETIEPGAEVISINDIPVNKILEQIYPHIAAERPYFKQAKLELFTFPRYYWQVFGEAPEFEVTLKSNGELKKHKIAAITALEGYEMKRPDIFYGKRELSFLNDIPYLIPGNFSGKIEEYQKFIDSAFSVIKRKNSKKLIIDLRNNGGGEDSFSDYLVSYIADKPFNWTSKFTLKTSQFLKEDIIKNKDTTDVYWQEALNRKNGEVYEYEFDKYLPQPKEKRFQGDVYLLVNRQSHSQSAVTAAQIQDYGFATIVGEETGEYPSLYASRYGYQLPKTGIHVNVSKGRIIRINGSTSEKGVIPDIRIKDYLLDEKDEVLDGLLARLVK
ncbi:peptidase S41 [Robertkochia marina]|uniref:Peptidase S41 n=1 Tax=Robertkochia marina TaxID=1227945 RepID=A0A4S3M1L0_9FLAO|nr:S41 family peptidase [Robertkochia marina]THD67335.1 peptidase S41 [Robertkochia marina]TRZ42992.1 peptidase S41 [Robertkochia marina]